MLARALLVLLALQSGAAFALEFRSLGDHAVVYDASSRQARPLFILRRGTPVEQLVALEAWVKIRDATGGIGWVERGLIRDKPLLMVTAERTVVRQSPSSDAPVTFTALREVLLEPLDKPASGWIRVRHQDGHSGYVELRAVWGQ